MGGSATLVTSSKFWQPLTELQLSIKAEIVRHFSSDDPHSVDEHFGTMLTSFNNLSRLGPDIPPGASPRGEVGEHSCSVSDFLTLVMVPSGLGLSRRRGASCFSCEDLSGLFRLGPDMPPGASRLT